METTFSVDPRLTSLLAENYRSTEAAIKELIDNAWDADATEVHITLPKIMTSESIKIFDNGSGMTAEELENEYLKIARDRISQKGEKTPKFNRKIKGRKGIGKFAGLIVASSMIIETSVRGEKIKFEISKKAFEEALVDLEKLEIPILKDRCDFAEHGTKIELKNLIENRNYPKPDKLVEILFYEYGRETNFTIFLNDSKIGLDDILGESFTYDEEIQSIGNIQLNYKIAEDKKLLKTPGIILKVNGKVVGSPSFFGLESDESIPPKILKRVYGEVNADFLEKDVTADWGAIIENSQSLEMMKEKVKEKVIFSLKEVYYRDFNLLKARVQKKLNEKIQKLPEYKRDFAEKEIQKVLAKFYDQSEDKIDVIVSFVIDAIEKDEYYHLLKKLENAKDLEVGILAGILDEYGILETGLILRQINVRYTILDSIDSLIENPKTLEIDIHKALENNLWILGREHQVISSNKTLKKIIEDYYKLKYQSDNRVDKRPDLLLAEQYTRDILLIEFKKPNTVIGRDHENQAEKYRDDLLKYLTQGSINVLIIGGSVDPKYNTNYQNNKLKLITYKETLSKARTEIKWLLSELTKA